MAVCTVSTTRKGCSHRSSEMQGRRAQPRAADTHTPLPPPSQQHRRHHHHHHHQQQQQQQDGEVGEEVDVNATRAKHTALIRATLSCCSGAASPAGHAPTIADTARRRRRSADALAIVRSIVIWLGGSRVMGDSRVLGASVLVCVSKGWSEQGREGCNDEYMTG